ncbi:bifunctional DNA primase/polymerase [Bradyrhizobium sp. NDS-1]|uniref:bifunctional DNA primase/polymerase n=1 Tax=Bradyrhizobium sp. NDS-1 TaxID=3080014 RepID=UPI00293E9D57|nr:bifunctional DNA primase/polymerase [Bradyrhizobium sp. NDS-1]WOH76439.1 bifunctional DNA primase/polymerase [Bradyrhizobium sp. NDS-1]
MASPFALTAPALIERGYSPLPIAPRIEPSEDRQNPPSGKEPGKFDAEKWEWFRLKGWGELCKRQAHPKIIAHWSTWPDAGVGVACGFGGLVAIDVDDDALVDPIREALPPGALGKRGKKGETFFVRAAEPMKSRPYNDANGIRLLDFLSDGRQTVLPGTVHPNTGRPYIWTTERTLLDTPLAELPAFTGAHVAAMEEVLARFGWADSERRQPRGEAMERPARSYSETASNNEFDAAVLAARPQWLRHPQLGLHGLHREPGGWRAVASFRASGSGRATGKRGFSLSIRDDGPIKDHGGRGYNDATLVAECAFGGDVAAAYDWLREQIGWTDAPLILLRNGVPAPTLAPTYPDQRVPLDAATARLRSLTGDDFAAAIQAGIGARNQERIKPSLIHPSHPVTVVRVEAGVGKTHTAIEAIAKLTRLGRRFVYVVPRHDLADQVAAGLAAHGVRVEVYRGYDRPDPRAPDTHLMCRNLPALEAARGLGVSIRSAVCERRVSVENVIVRCPMANVCGMERQREARPSVWVVPAALLHTERPDFFFEPDAVVIDEGFIDNALGEQLTLDVAALVKAKIELCDVEEHDAVERFRHRLAAAIKANGDGPLSRAALVDHGIAAGDAYAVGWLERRRINSSILRPDMRESELKTIAHRHAARNKLARGAAALWHEIATFLEEWKIESIIGDRSRSGRITVTDGNVSVAPLQPVHPSWRAPTLVLDATAPPASLLAIALGEIEIPGCPPVVTEQRDVAAKWPDHVRVRQVVGAPVSMSKLGLWKDAKPRNVRDIVRFIGLRAALAAPDRIGVVTYKGLLDQIAGQLPANVIARHFGALAGMNDMQDVAGLIVIGRPAAKRSAVEALASVFAGRPMTGGEGHFFDKYPGGIQLADGSFVATTVDRHPEPIAEALRWRITVGELLQAVGRLRPHRRSEPCWLDIVCDVPLPVTVHEVVRWAGAAPRATADMVAEGVVLTNSRDAGLAFGTTDWGARGVGGFSIESLIRDSTDSPPVRKFTYQKAGPGQKRYAGWYLPGILPGGVPALRGWLEGRLGPLASLEVERMQSRASLAEIGREAAGRLKFANVLSPALESIAAFFDDL